MKKYLENKNIIIAVVTIVLVLVLAFLIFKDTNKKKNNAPDKEEMITITDKEILKDQVVDGIDFKNKLFVIQDGVSRIIVELTNNTDNDYSLKEYSITIKDKENKVLATMPGYVGESIKKDEKKYLDVSIDRDLSKVAMIEYEVKK